MSQPSTTQITQQTGLSLWIAALAGKKAWNQSLQIVEPAAKPKL